MTPPNCLTPELTPVVWPLDRLTEYARNPRANSDQPVIDKMVASIKEFGFTVPILAQSDGTIIDGHLRYKAARKLNLSQVPVILADHLSAAQVKAFRLLANRSVQWASWDQDLLALEIADLAALDFDLNLTGFDPDELTNFQIETPAPAAETDEDDDPEPPIQPICRLGDVWTIGRHRLLCGDATDPIAVQRLMAGDRAGFCFTSPPYPSKRDYLTPQGDWLALMTGVFGQMDSVLTPDGQLLVNLGMQHEDGEWQPYWDPWIAAMREAGWRRFGWYVWDQGAGTFGDWHGRLAPSFEFIFHFNRVSRTPNKIIPNVSAGKMAKDWALRGTDADDMNRRSDHRGPAPIASHRIPDNVIRIERRCQDHRDAEGHPALFPMALVTHLLAAYTEPGMVCYEPFSGSGTTLLAGEAGGVNVRAMEIAPQYVDIALRRLGERCGLDAVRDDGALFSELLTDG